MRIERYDPSMKALWDNFIDTSKNATFIHRRDYMEYHADRYQDHSLLFYDDDKLVALLPANERSGILESHGGLTYGGILVDKHMGQKKMWQAFEGMMWHTFDNLTSGTPNRKIIYKPIPHIYHQLPAEEDLYCLWKIGANLVRRDVSTVVTECLPDERKKRNVAKGERMAWGESKDFAGFWKVLDHNLWDKHGLKPVHTQAEIELLARRFPKNITLFTATLHNEIMAGVVMYVTPTVAHVQYSASSDEGRQLGAMSYLTYQLIDKRYWNGVYFDFGISTEQQGKVLNEGLVSFKEGYGGRTVVYDQYEIKL